MGVLPAWEILCIGILFVDVRKFLQEIGDISSNGRVSNKRWGLAEDSRG